MFTASIPVAFMTTFPAEAVLGRLDSGVAPAAVGVAVPSFLAASAFWRFALRFYTGASKLRLVTEQGDSGTRFEFCTLKVFLPK